MKFRTAKSPTADLFAAEDASSASTPAPEPAPAPAPVLPALPLSPTPSLARRFTPRSWTAGDVPPPPQTADPPRSKQQLWYAVMFPKLIEAESPAAVLQSLCLHAQQFTSFVSIELPN